MQKIKYVNCDKEFLVESIIEKENYLGVKSIEIAFSNTTSFEEVRTFFDTNCISKNLRKMEIYTEEIKQEVVNDEPVETKEWVLQGVSNGFTNTVNISCFQSKIKVQIEKELAVESKIEKLEENNAILESALAEIAYGGAK